MTVVTIWRLLLAIGIFGLATSTIFLFMVFFAALRYRRAGRIAQAIADSTPQSSLPPVTIFKPLHGMEARLTENLESFFRQDYPNFEIIFGAREAGDEGLRAAEQVSKRYPKITCHIVVSGPPTFPNAKVFSLSKMLPLSTNKYLVFSDSDVRVEPDFLRNVIAPLLYPRIGLVTCPYRGVPSGDLWSTLEALGMSVEMPSGAMVADMLEGVRFALGPAIAMRRDALERIGGIGATADYYSDDYELGHKVWSAGYKVIFSHHVVQHVLTPRSFRRTIGDQLRWMKSTRYSRPMGHVGSGLTYAMPFALLALFSATALGRPWLGLFLFLAGLMNRVLQSIFVGWRVIRDRRALSLAWLYPLRDLQGFFMWIASFTSRKFFWRGETYLFNNGGKIVPQSREENSD